MQAGELTKALGQASAARELSNDPRGLQQIGQLRMRLALDHGANEADVVTAEADLQKAVANYGVKPPPSSCDIFAGLALAHASRGAFERALAELKRAAQADPLSPTPHLYRAYVLLQAHTVLNGGSGGDAGHEDNALDAAAGKAGDGADDRDGAEGGGKEGGAADGGGGGKDESGNGKDGGGSGKDDGAKKEDKQGGGGKEGGGGGEGANEAKLDGLRVSRLRQEAAATFFGAAMKSVARQAWPSPPPRLHSCLHPRGPLLPHRCLPCPACHSRPRHARRYTALLPETIDDCLDASLKRELFPGASLVASRQAKPPSSGRPGHRRSTIGGASDGGGADAAAATRPTLTQLLARADKREEVLALADALHHVALEAHRGRDMPRAAALYDMCTRLAERVARAAKGHAADALARAECLCGLALLNRAKLGWARSGEPDGIMEDLERAAKSFERALPAIDGGGLEDMVRRGAATAYYNLGAAQEAVALAAAVVAERERERASDGSRGSDSFRARRSAMQLGASSAPGGRRSPAECYDLALSYDPGHAGALVGRCSVLWRRHKPREALNQLGHPTLASSPAAQICRGVLLHQLGDDTGGAARELLAAHQARPESVFAAFNLAELRMLSGEWCAPLASLVALYRVSPHTTVAPMTLVDGSAAAERTLISAQLEPLIGACHKWQQCLQIACNDFRSSVRLLQPQVSLETPVLDRCFASPLGDADLSMVGVVGGADAAASSELRAPPLAPPQLALLEYLIEDAEAADSRVELSPETATGGEAADTATAAVSAASGGSECACGAASAAPAAGTPLRRRHIDDAPEGVSAPATALPSAVSAASLRRVLTLQFEGRHQQAERLLDAALRPLTLPASRPLGAVGALLYLWRARSRRLMGRQVEADADLRVALAHVGAESTEPLPEPLVAAIAEEDEEAASVSAAAAIDALARHARARGARAGAGDGVLGGDAGSDTPAYKTASDALDSDVAATAAAAVAVTRAAWWACGLLLEEGQRLERSAERAERTEAVVRYKQAIAWQPLHVIGAANAARLFEAEDNDVLSAAEAYLLIVRSTTLARDHAAEAAAMALADDDDEDEVIALREAAGKAATLRDELRELLTLLRNGFAQRAPEEGPPSEVPVARQQGRLAIAMDAERQRQEVDASRERPGVELSVPAAVAVRRRRVGEATKMGSALLAALHARPSRLFDPKDGALTAMLWGVEQSTVRLQAALSRGEQTGRRREASLLHARPATASDAEGAAARGAAQDRELNERLMRWGDDGQMNFGGMVNTPVTDDLIHRARQMAQADRGP